jgi:hypothetical protein
MPVASNYFCIIEINPDIMKTYKRIVMSNNIKNFETACTQPYICFLEVSKLGQSSDYRAWLDQAHRSAEELGIALETKGYPDGIALATESGESFNRLMEHTGHALKEQELAYARRLVDRARRLGTHIPERTEEMLREKAATDPSAWEPSSGPDEPA